MHLTKTFLVLRKLNLYNNVASVNVLHNSIIQRCRSSSGKTDLEEVGEPQAKSPAEEKKVVKGPFAKNLFAGVFDSDFLEYPEYPSMEYIKELKSMTNPVEEYCLNCVDSKTIDEKKEIPKEVFDSLKEHNLFSLSIPQKFGGLELEDRCLARYCEAIGSDMSLSTFFAAHSRVSSAIVVHGSEAQKNKYLPKLASGELTLGFCMVEKPSGFDPSDLETVALPNPNGDWVINGGKIWVANGCNADAFMVFAKTWQGSVNVNNSALLTVFLVDKDTPGVHCGPPLEQLGTRGVQVCDVTFDNVTVKNENILGEPGQGTEIAFECLSRGRLASAASAVGFLKNLFNMVTDHLIHTKVSGKAMVSFEFEQRQLGSIAADIYALESMVYLTAGIRDTYGNPDLSVEESIVKVFSMEKVVEIVDKCAALVGGYSYIKGSPLENFIRDSRSYLLHDIIPVNVTKVFIASLGLQHAGMEFKEDVKKNRNPFNFPGYVIKTAWKERHVLDDNSSIPGVLKLQLHPSLGGEAEKLERSVVRLEAVVKNLLRRWGIQIVDRQMDLIRLADCATSLYGMTAVVGRASRSYCIGLANSDVDLATAYVFCSVHHDKIKKTIGDIMEGPVETYDAPYFKIGETAASKKGYFFEHPLSRNY